MSEEELRELKNLEKMKVSFREKTSDLISGTAAGAVKATRKTKNIGKDIGEFAKQLSEKTKVTLDE